MIKFSFIVPCFNSEKYISQTIQSLIEQTIFTDCEIIVINDGSTDKSCEIIKDFCKKYDNIKYFEQQNSGVSAARNLGISNANGKYLMFVDSDDIIDPDCAQLLFEKAENKNADMVICRISKFGFRKKEFNPNADLLAKKEYISNFDKTLLYNFLVMNKCYKTEIVKAYEIKFPDTCYSEDAVFMMSYIMKTHPVIAGCFEAKTHYRRHKSSVTNKVSANLISNFIKSMEIVSSLLPSDNDLLKQELIYKTYYTIINEFYRLIWQADNEAVELMKNSCKELKEKMSPLSLDRLKRDNNRDILNPIFSRKEIAKKPIISIIVKKPSDSFLSSVYLQSNPLFEIVTDKLQTNSAFSDFENINYGEAKGNFKLYFPIKLKLHPGIFRKIILTLKLS